MNKRWIYLLSIAIVIGALFLTAPPDTRGATNCPVTPDDVDGDCVPNNPPNDGCPNQHGDISNGGCPIIIPTNTPNTSCPDGDNDGTCDVLDDCPQQGGPASNRGCPINQSTATDTPIPTNTYTPTPIGVNHNEACNVATASTYRVNIRASTSTDAESPYTMDPFNDQLTVIGAVTIQGVDGQPDYDWYQVQAGWVRSDVIEIGGHGCPTPELEDSVWQDCPELADAYNSLSPEDQEAYDQMPNACAVLARNTNFLPIELEIALAGSAQTMLGNCTLLVPDFNLRVERIAATDLTLAQDIVNELRESPDPCAYANSMMLNGYRHSNNDEIDEPVIASCLQRVRDERVGQIQSIAQALGLDVDDLDEALCEAIENLSMIGSVGSEEVGFYNHLIACPYAPIDAIRLLIDALSQNANLTAIVNSGNFCDSIIERIEQHTRQYDDIPEEIQQCDIELVNLFMRIVLMPDSPLDEREIQRILQSPNPCAAIELYLLYGIIPYVVVEQPTPTPTVSQTGQTGQPPTLTPTPTATMMPTLVVTSTRTPIPLPPAYEGVTISSYVRSSGFYVGSATVDDPDSTDIYQIVAGESQACLRTPENEYQPTYNDSGDEGGGDVLGLAFYQVDDSDNVSLIVIDSCDGEVLFEIGGYEFDYHTRIAWNPGTMQLFVTIKDDGIPAIYELNLGSDNPEPQLRIENASNPVIVDGDKFMVFERDGQLAYIYRAQVLQADMSQYSIVSVDIQPTTEICFSATNVPDERVAKIAFICGEQILTGPLRPDSNVAGNCGEEGVVCGGIPDNSRNLAFHPDFFFYSFDDGHSIYSYTFTRGAERVIDNPDNLINIQLVLK